MCLLYYWCCIPAYELNPEKFVSPIANDKLDDTIPGILESDRAAYCILEWVDQMKNIRTNENQWSDLNAFIVDRIDHVRAAFSHSESQPEDSQSEDSHTADTAHVGHEAIAFKFHYTTTYDGEPITYQRAAIIHRVPDGTNGRPAVETVDGWNRYADARDEVRIDGSYELLGISRAVFNLPKYRCIRSLIRPAAPKNTTQRQITALDIAILAAVIRDLGDQYNIRHTCMWHATILYLSVQRLARVGDPDASLQHNGLPDAGTDVLGTAFEGVRLVNAATGRLVNARDAQPTTTRSAMGRILDGLRGAEKKRDELAAYLSTLDCGDDVPQDLLDIILVQFEERMKSFQESIRRQVERGRGRVGEIEREIEALIRERAAREREREEERAAWEREREEERARQTALEGQIAQIALLLNRFPPLEPSRVDETPSASVVD